MRDAIPIELMDHQHEVEIPTRWLRELREAALRTWRLLPQHVLENHSLDEMEALDIALVSAAESDRIHREFMRIDEATDVITFLHGELIICPAVAEVQAVENQEPVLRELLRYIVHGMLHLAGHLDDQESRRIVMEEVQEQIVADLWSMPEFLVFAEENTKFPSK